jgi:hypothetical protein
MFGGFIRMNIKNITFNAVILSEKKYNLKKNKIEHVS